MKIRNFLYYKLLPIVIAVFFGLMLLNTIVIWPYILDPPWIPLWVTALAGIIVYALAVLFVWSRVRRLLEKRTFKPGLEKKILIIFFAVLVLVQAGFASQMHISLEPQCMMNLASGEKSFCLWDFNYITQGAIDTVNKGQGIDETTLDYLHTYPNNIPIFALLTGVFELASLVHVTDFAVVGTMLNIIAIDGALLLMYLIARKLFGAKKALFALAVALLVLPLTFFYVPIFYTDTLSLPFPLAIIYLYLKLRESKSRWRYAWLLVALALLAFMGSLIKPTVAIVLIAIVIDMFMRCKKGAILTIQRAILSLVAIIIIFIPLLASYNALSNKYIHSQTWDNKGISIPWTHWIMMGMHGTGGYDMDDMILTLDHESQADATEFNVQVIKYLLQQHGPVGYLRFLLDKATITWTNGSFESFDRLHNGDGKFITKDYRPSWLQEVITDYAVYPLTLFNYVQAVFGLLLGAVIIGAVQSFRSKSKKLSDMALLQISLLGLVLFLLIWEASSRYVINYLPIIILLATPILWQVSRTIIAKIGGGYRTIRRKILKY
jgi:hypothetical protein